MKKEYLIFFCFILALVAIFSCSNNSTGPNDFPDNPLDWFSFSYMMEIGVYGAKGVDIEIFTLDSLTTGELTINGQTVPLEISGWFFYWIYSPIFDSSFTPLNAGDSISYTLAVNGKTYSGDMNITYRPETIWADTFDQSQDYSFSWDIAQQPMLYVCDFEVYYHDDEHIEKDYNWILDSPLNEYTIKTKYYDDYGDLDDIDIMLASYNYRNFGSCFVYSTGYRYKNYYFYKDNYPQPDKRSLQFSRLKNLVTSIE